MGSLGGGLVGSLAVVLIGSVRGRFRGLGWSLVGSLAVVLIGSVRGRFRGLGWGLVGSLAVVLVGSVRGRFRGLGWGLVGFVALVIDAADFRCSCIVCGLSVPFPWPWRGSGRLTGRGILCGLSVAVSVVLAGSWFGLTGSWLGKNCSVAWVSGVESHCRFALVVIQLCLCAYGCALVVMRLCLCACGCAFVAVRVVVRARPLARLRAGALYAYMC